MCRCFKPGVLLTLSFPPMNKMDCLWMQFTAVNGLLSGAFFSGIVKRGARCDTVEAAGFVSGVLLLERLNQQTHNLQAIKGHMFLTLVCSFFFFFPFILPQLSSRLQCHVLQAMFSFFIKAPMWTTGFKVVRPNECLLESAYTSGLSEIPLSSTVTLIVCLEH